MLSVSDIVKLLDQLPLWRHLVRLPFYVLNRLIAARSNG